MTRDSTSITEFKDTECLVLVQDLIGFATPLREANWNPSAAEIQELLSRLARFQDFRYISGCVDRIFALNDTLVRVLDTPHPLRQSIMVFTWLYFACLRHHILNSAEIEDGLPGVRSVVAGGHRYTVSEGNIVGDDSRFFAGGGAKPEIKYYCPEELQLNLAFTRAYLLNESGSGCGIGGHHFYVDRDAIDLLRRSMGKDDSEANGIIRDLVIEERNSQEWRVVFEMPKGYTWCDGPMCRLTFALPPIEVQRMGMSTCAYRLSKITANTDIGPYFPSWGPTEFVL